MADSQFEEAKANTCIIGDSIIDYLDGEAEDLGLSVFGPKAYLYLLGSKVGLAEYKKQRENGVPMELAFKRAIFKGLMAPGMEIVEDLAFSKLLNGIMPNHNAVVSADLVSDYISDNKNSHSNKSAEIFDDIDYLNYNSDERISFQNYSNSIKRGELSAIVDFKTYKKIDEDINTIIGTTAEGNLKITQKSNHFINRVIGSIYQRRSGVSVDNIKKALLNPTEIIKKEDSWKYYLEGVCSVTVNPRTGRLIQTNPEHSLKVTE